MINKGKINKVCNYNKILVAGIRLLRALFNLIFIHFVYVMRKNVELGTVKA